MEGDIFLESMLSASEIGLLPLYLVTDPVGEVVKNTYIPGFQEDGRGDIEQVIL